MAREALSVQQVTREGLEPTPTTAVEDGHYFSNDGRVFLSVENGSGAQITVTIETPGTVDEDLAVADRTVDVPAGETRFIGSFPPADYNQGDRTVFVDYSAYTDVSVMAIKL